MTFEQQVDLKALSLIIKGKIYPNSELVELYATIISHTQATELHKKFAEKGYYNREKFKDPEYSLHERASFYLEYLQKEKEKEEIDSLLKQISYSNIKSNKNFPLYALIVAVFAIVVPVILQRCQNNDTVVYKLDQRQFESLLHHKLADTLNK